jgi:hypothetical protein
MLQSLHVSIQKKAELGSAAVRANAVGSRPADVCVVTDVH